MEESPLGARGLQMDLERFHDGPVVEQIAEVLAGALELPRGEQFADVDPTEGRGIFGADQSRPGGVHFEDRAPAVDQERRVRGDLEQLAEPGLRSADELLRPLLLREVPRDDRASDQATRAIPERRDRQGDDDLVSVFPDPHGLEGLDLLAVPEVRHDPRELLLPFLRHEHLDRFANRLRGGVSVDMFRAGVPGQDLPREALREDGVLGTLDDRGKSGLRLPRSDELGDVDEGRDDRREVSEVEVLDRHECTAGLARLRADLNFRVPDRSAFFEVLTEHPPLLLIDPHLELEGRPPDDLTPIVPEEPEELLVRFHEPSILERTDRHRHGTRVEGLLERLDRSAPRGLDPVPFKDLTDPTPDVGQEVQERLVRLADRVAEEDGDGLDAGTCSEREADGAPQAESFGVLRPPELGLLAKVSDPDGRISLPHTAHETDARPNRDAGRRELEAMEIAQAGRMPHPVEPEDRGGRIVQPEFPEGPFLGLADRGDGLRRGFAKGLRIDQYPGDRDFGRAVPVCTQPVRHVVQEDQPGASGENGDLGRKDLDVEDRPVLPLVPPDTDHPVARVEAPQGLAEAGDILPRPDVLERQREELGPRVAVFLDRRVVHVEESDGLEVEDPHRERILLKQEPIGLRFRRGASLLPPFFRLRTAPSDGDSPFARWARGARLCRSPYAVSDAGAEP
jgi:hypothetical protein